MPFESARCPNCGGDLKIDDNSEQCYCNFCGSKIIVRDAIQKYKLELEGKVNVEGISSIKSLLLRGNQSLEENLFKDAIRFFDKVINIEPKNSDAWWGKFIALYKEALSVPPDKYYAYSINNEVFDVKEKGLVIEKAFNSAGISNYDFYNKTVGLIPYIDKKCFFSGQRAIEFSEEKNKKNYTDEYKRIELEYQKIKEWSDKTIRKYIADKEQSKSSSSKGCLFGVLSIPAIIIGLVIENSIDNFIVSTTWGVVFSAIWITLIILSVIFFLKSRDKKLIEKYKKYKYYNR